MANQTFSIVFADLGHNGAYSYADVFPLGIGSIAAYTKEVFGEALRMEIHRSVDDLLASLQQSMPTVLAVSNYIWNHNLAYAFSERVKELSPETVVIWGGPNFPLHPSKREAFLAARPTIDFYIKWEGEFAFVELIRQLRGADFDAQSLRAAAPVLGNCTYLAGQRLVDGPDQRVKDFAALPSPYTTGILDAFFDTGLRPIIETTRGCPYGCTFCNSAHSYHNKITRRSAQFVRDELEYIAAHVTQPVDLLLADNNFGMFLDDLEYAQALRDTIDKYDWPRTLGSNTLGKSQPERVREAVKIINKGSGRVMNFASSFQSTDPEVLSAIKRVNLPLDALSPLIEADEVANGRSSYFTELILGLPGDTKEKHFRSLKDCVDTLGSNFVNSHQLALVDGAPMAEAEDREKYGLKTRFRVLITRLGRYDVIGVQRLIAEIEEIVVATDTMPFEHWLDCREMDLLVKIFIDNDMFEEIFGLVRRLGLSPFEVLVQMHQDLAAHPALARLLADFRAKTVEPLFETEAALRTFLERPDTLDRYAAGELGGNELMIHRAQAFRECNQDLHTALASATTKYLAANGHDSATLRSYLDQAATYSRLRKFDIDTCDVELSGRFDFDFPAAEDSHFKVLPEDIAIAPAQFRFLFSAEDRDVINYLIGHWLSSKRGEGKMAREAGIGRIYQSSAVRSIRRKVTPS